MRFLLSTLVFYTRSQNNAIHFSFHYRNQRLRILKSPIKSRFLKSKSLSLFEETHDFFFDYFDSALRIALDIERHNGVVNRESE